MNNYKIVLIIAGSVTAIAVTAVSSFSAGMATGVMFGRLVKDLENNIKENAAKDEEKKDGPGDVEPVVVEAEVVDDEPIGS